MTIELHGDMFINVEIFEEFIKKNLREDFYFSEDTFSKWLEDLQHKASEAGYLDCGSYEMGAWETKSGNPESITYGIERKFYIGEKQVFTDEEIENSDNTIAIFTF